MGRKKKDKPEEGIPAWLITFGDMMTLLLTFFVLLVSMARVDERRKLVVLGSIIGTFGWGKQSYDVLSLQDTRRTVEPGPMNDIDDLEMLKPLLWENAEEDISFEQGKFVDVFSISADVLFGPGKSTLTEDGKKILLTILPVLKKVTKPLLLAGHTSSLRDEMGMEFRVDQLDDIPDISWRLSLNRVLTVYLFLIDQGMNPDQLKVEAFGKFHPHYPDDSPKDRRRNRRVDIVLDRRNKILSTDIKEVLPNIKTRTNVYEYNGFVFDVNETAP
ncbi:MAG: chemotaxis protein MotB [Desulfovibrionales bacterium]|jgi:chemotaxis protein MotB|nr:chemotaxis protein MotB [Desulfovibrionales bacterium]